MKINELRTITKLSQKQFADYFGIPVGTLRNWEQKIASPPDYVLKMIFTSIRRDKMINVETIKFIKMLDELAFLSKNGIAPFDEANEKNINKKIFYDHNSKDENGGYPIILDSCVLDDTNCYHHDIISYYDSNTLEYQIRAISVIDDKDDMYIHVKLLNSEETIIIKNGIWYFD